MDFEEWKSTQKVKANVMPTDLELKIQEFYSKCQKKFNYGASEIVSNKLLILQEQYNNFQTFFENISDEIFDYGYCDED